MRFLHAFDQHPVPEFESLSHVCEMRCAGSQQLGLHTHRGFEICYVVSGRLLRTTESRCTVVHPGACVISPPGERHGRGTDPDHPCHYFSVGFDPAQLSLESLDPARRPGVSGVSGRERPATHPSLISLALAQRVVTVGPGLEALFRRMLQEMEALPTSDAVGRSLGVMMIRTQLVEVLILLMQARHRQSDSSGPAPAQDTLSVRSAFRELMRYLSSHLADPPTLSAMAARVQLSTPHFCSAFTREVGESPMAWMARKRLEAAAQVLGDTRQTIASLSRTLGFRTPQYFSDRFRRRYGLTPTQWRARQASLR